jgi:hypothetical protein
VTYAAVELETVEPVESAPLGQPAPVSDEQPVAMLVERAGPEGLQLTGQGGLLQQLTKRVLELLRFSGWGRWCEGQAAVR